jgi:hypothetical protein
VYYWKVQLNPTTHDPDSTTLVCIRAKDNSALKGDGYISGLKPTLEANGDLHMTFKKDDTDFYYFVFNWTTAT